MTAEKLRIGVIGLGLISPAHLAGYAAAEGCELAVVCDVDQARVDRVSAEHGVPGTTDYRSILADPTVDAVALLLPHQLHHPIGLEALAAGKHVCMEKPLAVTEAEARDLERSAAERGLTLAVAENTRYVDAYIDAAELVASGELGEIRLVRGFIPDQIIDEWADRSDPTQDWKREPAGCGALIDCAPHMLQLLHWFFGEVESLQAMARRWVPEIPLENLAVITGSMVGGTLFSMEFSSITEYPRGERVEIYGSAGTLIIDQVLDPPAVFYRGDGDPHGTPRPIRYDLAGWKPRSVAETAVDFIGALREQRPPLVSAAEGRYVVRLVELAYASIDAGGAVIDVATGATPQNPERPR
jgi:predicted dehydrogenase